MLRYACITQKALRLTRGMRRTLRLPRRLITNCVLCDRHVTEWPAHAALPSHQARVAICTTFAAPERGAAILQQLQRHIQLDFAAVDAATQEKIQRRRTRLRETLRHLVSVHVLHYSLPQQTALDSNEDTSVCDKRFMSLVCLGEAYAWREGIDRVARLMPSLDARALSATVAYLLSARELARLVDAMELQHVFLAHNTKDEDTQNVTSNSSSGVAQENAEGTTTTTTTVISSTHFTQEAKAMILLAVLGELHAFSRRDRSHCVLDKAAADELVHNVLATHAMQNLLSELVHGVLQRIVDECTPVWDEYQRSEKARKLEEEKKQQQNDKSRDSVSKRESEQRRLDFSPPLQSVPTPKPTRVTQDSQEAAVKKMSAELQGFMPCLHAVSSSSYVATTQSDVSGPAVFGHTCRPVRVRWDKMVTLPPIAEGL